MSKPALAEFLAGVKERYEKAKKEPSTEEEFRERLLLLARVPADAEVLLKMVEAFEEHDEGHRQFCGHYVGDRCTCGWLELRERLEALVLEEKRWLICNG